MWLPSPGTVFRLLLVARLVSAFCMYISDCDETFNYWEPVHYLLYGSGFQTWEYSPTYAVRSYGYLLLHTLPLLATNATNKLVAFYLLRVLLATVCTLCEFYFYRAVLEKFGRRVALWTLLFLLSSCGMFVAAPAFLPSSFTMYLSMVALGAWFGGNYELAVFAVATSAIVGWPFSAVLGLPIAFDIVFSQKRPGFFIAWSLFCFLVIAVPLAIVDSLYYGKFVLAPANIVLYNVFGKGGPNLYGVEPWSFYLINGFLNFNVVFVLALMAIPLIEFEVLLETLITNIGRGYSVFEIVYRTLLTYSGKASTPIHGKTYRMAVQSMLIWILIFFSRPHKEERFLFPIYPLFCLSAAVALQLLPELVPIFFGLIRVPRVLKKLSRTIFTWLPLVVCVIHATLSLSRGYALYRGYHAPIDVYRVLSSELVLSRMPPIKEVNLCVGKEWHRFPSSFFLPNKLWKLRFVQSEFRGQLPKPYSPHRNATWIIPEDMNDMNREEPSRYFDIAGCHFLVDLDLPVTTEREPRYAQDSSSWDLMASYPFLDPTRSHKLFRAFYIPWLSPTKTTYAEYLLLKNRKLFAKFEQKTH